MIRIRLKPRGRAGLIAVRLAILAVPVAVVVGCGDDNHGGGKPTATATVAANTPTAVPTNSSPPAPTSTATPLPTNTSPPSSPTPNANASAACDKLAGCQQCFINATGQCIASDACAQRLAADVAVCINGVTGCDSSTLGDCLFLGCDGADATGECQ